MPKFIYIATNSQNKSITGTIDTTDKGSAIAAITKQGLRPISVKEGSSTKKGSIEIKFLTSKR